MVQRHEHHDKPAQQIHRIQPLASISNVGWPAGGVHLFLEKFAALEHKRDSLEGKMETDTFIRPAIAVGGRFPYTNRMLNDNNSPL